MCAGVCVCVSGGFPGGGGSGVRTSGGRSRQGCGSMCNCSVAVVVLVTACTPCPCLDALLAECCPWPEVYWAMVTRLQTSRRGRGSWCVRACVRTPKFEYLLGMPFHPLHLPLPLPPPPPPRVMTHHA